MSVNGFPVYLNNSLSSGAPSSLISGHNVPNARQETHDASISNTCKKSTHSFRSDPVSTISTCCQRTIQLLQNPENPTFISRNNPFLVYLNTLFPSQLPISTVPDSTISQSDHRGAILSLTIPINPRSRSNENEDKTSILISGESSDREGNRSSPANWRKASNATEALQGLLHNTTFEPQTSSLSQIIPSELLASSRAGDYTLGIRKKILLPENDICTAMRRDVDFLSSTRQTRTMNVIHNVEQEDTTLIEEEKHILALRTPGHPLLYSKDIQTLFTASSRSSPYFTDESLRIPKDLKSIEIQNTFRRHRLVLAPGFIRGISLGIGSSAGVGLRPISLDIPSQDTYGGKSAEESENNNAFSTSRIPASQALSVSSSSDGFFHAILTPKSVEIYSSLGDLQLLKLADEAETYFSQKAPKKASSVPPTSSSVPSFNTSSSTSYLADIPSLFSSKTVSVSPLFWTAVDEASVQSTKELLQFLSTLPHLKTQPKNSGCSTSGGKKETKRLNSQKNTSRKPNTSSSSSSSSSSLSTSLKHGTNILPNRRENSQNNKFTVGSGSSVSSTQQRNSNSLNVSAINTSITTNTSFENTSFNTTALNKPQSLPSNSVWGSKPNVQNGSTLPARSNPTLGPNLGKNTNEKSSPDFSSAPLREQEEETNFLHVLQKSFEFQFASSTTSSSDTIPVAPTSFERTLLKTTTSALSNLVCMCYVAVGSDNGIHLYSLSRVFTPFSSTLISPSLSPWVISEVAHFFPMQNISTCAFSPMVISSVPCMESQTTDGNGMECSSNSSSVFHMYASPLLAVGDLNGAVYCLHLGLFTKLVTNCTFLPSLASWNLITSKNKKMVPKTIPKSTKTDMSLDFENCSRCNQTDMTVVTSDSPLAPLILDAPSLTSLVSPCEVCCLHFALSLAKFVSQLLTHPHTEVNRENSAYITLTNPFRVIQQMYFTGLDDIILTLQPLGLIVQKTKIESFERDYQYLFSWLTSRVIPQNVVMVTIPNSFSPGSFAHNFASKYGYQSGRRVRHTPIWSLLTTFSLSTARASVTTLLNAFLSFSTRNGSTNISQTTDKNELHSASCPPWIFSPTRFASRETSPRLPSVSLAEWLAFTLFQGDLLQGHGRFTSVGFIPALSSSRGWERGNTSMSMYSVLWSTFEGNTYVIEPKIVPKMELQVNKDDKSDEFLSSSFSATKKEKKNDLVASFFTDSTNLPADCTGLRYHIKRGASPLVRNSSQKLCNNTTHSFNFLTGSEFGSLLISSAEDEALYPAPLSLYPSLTSSTSLISSFSPQSLPLPLPLSAETHVDALKESLTLFCRKIIHAYQALHDVSGADPTLFFLSGLVSPKPSTSGIADDSKIDGKKHIRKEASVYDIEISGREDRGDREDSEDRATNKNSDISASSFSKPNFARLTAFEAFQASPFASLMRPLISAFHPFASAYGSNVLSQASSVAISAVSSPQWISSFSSALNASGGAVISTKSRIASCSTAKSSQKEKSDKSGRSKKRENRVTYTNAPLWQTQSHASTMTGLFGSNCPSTSFSFVKRTDTYNYQLPYPYQRSFSSTASTSSPPSTCSPRLYGRALGSIYRQQAFPQYFEGADLMGTTVNNLSLSTLSPNALYVAVTRAHLVSFVSEDEGQIVFDAVGKVGIQGARLDILSALTGGLVFTSPLFHAKISGITSIMTHFPRPSRRIPKSDAFIPNSRAVLCIQLETGEILFAEWPSLCVVPETVELFEKDTEIGQKIEHWIEAKSFSSTTLPLLIPPRLIFPHLNTIFGRKMAALLQLSDQKDKLNGLLSLRIDYPILSALEEYFVPESSLSSHLSDRNITVSAILGSDIIKFQQSISISDIFRTNQSLSVGSRSCSGECKPIKVPICLAFTQPTLQDRSEETSEDSQTISLSKSKGLHDFLNTLDDITFLSDDEDENEGVILGGSRVVDQCARNITTFPSSFSQCDEVAHIVAFSTDSWY